MIFLFCHVKHKDKVLSFSFLPLTSNFLNSSKKGFLCNVEHTFHRIFGLNDSILFQKLLESFFVSIILKPFPTMCFFLQLHEFPIIPQLYCYLWFGEPDLQHCASQVLIVKAAFSLLKVFVQANHCPNCIFAIKIWILKHHFPEKCMVHMNGKTIVNDSWFLLFFYHGVDLVLCFVFY